MRKSYKHRENVTWRMNTDMWLTPWMNQKPHVADKQLSEHHVCNIKLDHQIKFIHGHPPKSSGYKETAMSKQESKPWNSLQKENISIASYHTKSFIWVPTTKSNYMPRTIGMSNSMWKYQYSYEYKSSCWKTLSSLERTM